MRGEILGYSAAEQKGVITGENGQRYSFTQTEWKEDGPFTKGMKVDFNPIDNQATAIFSVIQQPSAPTHNGGRQFYPNNSPQAQITFIEAIKRCFEQYADGYGRATRKEYWFFRIFRFLIFIFMVAGLFFIVFLEMHNRNISRELVKPSMIDYFRVSSPLIKFIVHDPMVGIMIIFLGIFELIYLATIIPTFFVCVRRLHDTGRSGWQYLWNFFPIIGWIYLFILMLLPSTPGPNQYGPPQVKNDNA